MIALRCRFRLELSGSQNFTILLHSKQLTASAGHLILKWSYIDMRRQKRGVGAARTSTPRTLAELPTGQRCILDRLDLPEDVARRLMEMGFLPGNEVVPGKRAPGGGARVFQVDGSEVALRDDTAGRLYVRRDPESDFVVLS